MYKNITEHRKRLECLSCGTKYEYTNTNHPCRTCRIKANKWRSDFKILPIRASKLYPTLTRRLYSMKGRCKFHKDYGDRGIEVCAEWANNTLAFCEWATKEGFEPSLEIDRENNNGNYEPNNCRFVTRIVNLNNKRKYKVKGTIQERNGRFRVRVAKLELGWYNTRHEAEAVRENEARKMNTERNR